MAPPHRQTATDRAALTALIPYFSHFPANFTFPIVEDPNYKPKWDTTYVLVTAGICFLLTSTIVLSRLWIRSKLKFGMDDWIIMPAFLSYSIFGLVNIVGSADTGLGYHITDLAIVDINSALLIEFLHTIFWTFSLNLTRLSILYLLLRLVTKSHQLAFIYIQTVIIGSWLFLFGNILFLIFQCKPIKAGWNIGVRQRESACAGDGSLVPYGVLCASHVFLDLLTIVPPIPVIATLKIERAKKVNLYLLLGLGSITMVLSLVRIFIYYKKAVEGYDITRDLIPVGFFGILEASFALIVACLPALNRYIISGMSALKSLKSKIASKSATLTSNIFHRNHIPAPNIRIYRDLVDSTGYSADVTSATTTLRTYDEIEMERKESQPEILVEKSVHLTTLDIEV